MEKISYYIPASFCVPQKKEYNTGLERHWRWVNDDKKVIFSWTALLSGGADDRCVVCVCGCVKREKVCGRTCLGIVLWVSLRQELELWSSLSLSPDWWDETAGRLPASHQILSPFYSLSHSNTFFLVLFFNQSSVTLYAHLFSLSLTPWAFFSLSFSHSFQSALWESLALLQNPASSLHRVGVLLWKKQGCVYTWQVWFDWN